MGLLVHRFTAMQLVHAQTTETIQSFGGLTTYVTSEVLMLHP